MGCSTPRRKSCLRATPDRRVREQAFCNLLPKGASGALRLFPVRAMLHGRMIGLAVTILAVASLCSSGAQAARWGKEYFPEVSLVTQDGKTLRFYDDLIKDKVFVINFLYTTCRDICPLTASRLGELQEKLGDSVGRDIFIYSISIDPETDTPERLKQYAQTFRAGPGWLFLTGQRGDIGLL